MIAKRNSIFHMLWYQFQQLITAFWVMLMVVLPSAWLRGFFSNKSKSSTGSMDLMLQSDHRELIGMQALTHFFGNSHHASWGALAQTTTQTSIPLPLIELAAVEASGHRIIKNANATRVLVLGGKDYGLKIWEIENQLFPRLVGVFGKVTPASNNFRSGILDKNEQLLYVTDTSRLIIINWSESVPKLVASINTGMNAEGITLSENEQRVFLFGRDQQNVPTFCTVDLTDLTQEKVERIPLSWVYSGIQTSTLAMAYSFKMIAKQDNNIIVIHNAWTTQGTTSQNCGAFETTLRILDASNSSIAPLNKGQLSWSGCKSAYVGIIEDATFGGSSTQILIAVAPKSSHPDPLSVYSDNPLFASGPRPGVHIIDIHNASTMTIQGSSVRVSANAVNYDANSFLALAANSLFGMYFFDFQQISSAVPVPLMAQWQIQGGIRELALDTERQLILSVSGQTLTTWLFRGQLDRVPNPLFTVQASLKAFAALRRSNLQVNDNRAYLTYGNAVWLEDIYINDPLKPTVLRSVLTGGGIKLENSDSNQVLVRKADQRLFVLSANSLIEVNVTTDTPITLKQKVWTPKATTMALSTDQEMLMVADASLRMTLLNATNTSRILSTFSVFDSVNSIRFSKDSQRVYLGCSQGVVIVDVNNGNIISSLPLKNTVGLALNANETLLLAGFASDDGSEFGLAKFNVSSPNATEPLYKQTLPCHARTIALDAREQLAFLGCDNAILVDDLSAVNIMYSYPTSDGLRLQYQAVSDSIYTNEIEVLTLNKEAFKVIPLISHQLQEDNPTLITGETLTGKFVFFVSPKLDIQQSVKPKIYNISLIEKDGTVKPLPTWFTVNQTGEFSAQVPREFAQTVTLRFKLAGSWSSDVSLSVIEGSFAPTPLVTTNTPSSTPIPSSTTTTPAPSTAAVGTPHPTTASTTTAPVTSIPTTQVTLPSTLVPTPFFVNSSTIPPSDNLMIDNNGAFPQIISTAVTVTVQMGVPLGQFMLNGPWTGLLAEKGIHQVAMSITGKILTLVGPPQYINAVLAQIRYSPQSSPYNAEETFPMLATQAGVSGWVKADPRFGQFKTNHAPSLLNATFDLGPFARGVPMSLPLTPQRYFKDPDATDTYEVILTQADGSSLPTDLLALKNAQNSQAILEGFSYSSIVLDLIYYVKDDGGMESPKVPLKIVFTNMPPKVLLKIPEVTFAPGTISYTVPGPAFEGNNLVMTATLPGGASLLTVGLNFDPRFSMLSGYYSKNGKVTVVYRGTTIPSGDFTEQTVDYSFFAPPPTIIATMLNKTVSTSTGRISEDLALYFNGSSLTFSTVVKPPNTLPSWLSIDPVTNKLFGTPGAADVTSSTGLLYIFQLLGINNKNFLEIFGKQQAPIPFTVVATDPTGASVSQDVMYQVDYSFDDWLKENGAVLFAVVGGLFTLGQLYQYWTWIPNMIRGIRQGYVKNDVPFIWDHEECVHKFKLPYAFNVQVIFNKQLHPSDLDFGPRVLAAIAGCISYHAGSRMLLHPCNESWVKHDDETNTLIIDPQAISQLSKLVIIDIMTISGRILMRLMMVPQKYLEIQMGVEARLLEDVPQIVTEVKCVSNKNRQNAYDSPQITAPITNTLIPAKSRTNPLHSQSLFANREPSSSMTTNPRQNRKLG